MRLALVLHTCTTLGVAIHGCAALPRSTDGPEANLQAQTLVRDCVHRSADVARSAAKICGSLPIEEALRTVAIMPPAAARRASELLAELGFRTALDLELLGGGEEAAEVLEALKAGGVSPADRAKLRVLLGDQHHLQRLGSGGSWSERLVSTLASDEVGPAESTTPAASWHDASASVRGATAVPSATGRRALQEDSTAGGGLSIDTIAIVLSVLVGAAGYVMQAYTARRSERAQAQQALQLHTDEQKRDRRHQMTTAQIERIHKSLDKCCRPVLLDLYANSNARYRILAQLVAKMEVSHPTAVEQMLSKAQFWKRNADGTLVSRRTGAVWWTPTPPPELTRLADSLTFGAPTEAVTQIISQDIFATWAGALCFELPTAILDVIATEPAGEIAEMYRGYVRHSLMPLCRRVADQLREYSPYVELPSKEWLKETFPKEAWKTLSSTHYLYLWYGYTLSFDRVLSEWSCGKFESIHPGLGLPLGPLLRTLTWSQEQAEKKQAELIGMSAVVETDALAFSRPEVASASFAKQTSAYEVEMQSGAQGAGVVSEASFAMPLARDN